MSHSPVNNEDPYQEIRPYRDDEVGQVLFDLGAVTLTSFSLTITPQARCAQGHRTLEC